MQNFLILFLEFLSVFLNITYFSNYFCLGMQKKIEIGFLQLIYRPNCGFTLLPTACRLPTANFGQLPIADGIQKTRQNGMYSLVVAQLPQKTRISVFEKKPHSAGPLGATPLEIFFKNIDFSL